MIENLFPLKTFYGCCIHYYLEHRSIALILHETLKNKNISNVIVYTISLIVMDKLINV